MFDDNGSFLLALLEFFLFFAWIMCLFYVFADIFRSHDMGGFAKACWVVGVIIVPLLGVLVYMLARGQGMHERQLEQMQGGAAGPEPSTSSPSPHLRRRRTDQIADAKGLLDSGAITQAEFDQLKAKALSAS